MYERHGIGDPYSVFTRGIGADGPIVEVQFFGGGLADLYQASEAFVGEVGEDMNELQARVGEASRRIEIINYNIRRDLNYTPAN